MARKICCDGCSTEMEDTEANRQAFLTVEFKKVTAGAPVFKAWELCTDCAEKVRAVIARLAS